MGRHVTDQIGEEEEEAGGGDDWPGKTTKLDIFVAQDTRNRSRKLG